MLDACQPNLIQRSFKQQVFHQQISATLTVTASLLESGFHLASSLVPYSFSELADRQRQTISTDG